MGKGSQGQNKWCFSKCKAKSIHQKRAKEDHESKVLNTRPKKIYAAGRLIYWVQLRLWGYNVNIFALISHYWTALGILLHADSDCLISIYCLHKMYLAVAGCLRRVQMCIGLVSAGKLHTAGAQIYSTRQAGHTSITFYPNKSSVNIYLGFFVVHVSFRVFCVQLTQSKMCSVYKQVLDTCCRDGFWLSCFLKTRWCSQIQTDLAHCQRICTLPSKICCGLLCVQQPRIAWSAVIAGCCNVWQRVVTFYQQRRVENK